MERKGKGRRRENKAVWPYIHSHLTQTKKRKRPKQVIMQTVQTTNVQRQCHDSRRLREVASPLFTAKTGMDRNETRRLATLSQLITWPMRYATCIAGLMKSGSILESATFILLGPSKVLIWRVVSDFRTITVTARQRQAVKTHHNRLSPTKQTKEPNQS